MKWVLLLVALVLAFGGGGARLRGLVSAVKRLPRDFAAGKSRAEDPVRHARDVTPKRPDDVS